MDTARVIAVVETTLTRRGKGVEGDPIKSIHLQIGQIYGPSTSQTRT
jgi:hypothetical protein